MRIHFQHRPLDLILCIGYSLAVLAVLLLVGNGSPLAVMLVVFLPGYSTVAAIFPKKNQLSWAERITYSFALSISIVAVLGLALDYTPFGIQFDSIVVAVSIFTVAVTGFAYLRRMGMDSKDRLSLDLGFQRPAWAEYRRSEKIVVLASIAGIVIASSALAYLGLSSQGARFTELYLLGPGGNASGYPTSLKAHQQGTTIAVVSNHEGATLKYVLRIDLVGVLFVYNATSMHNETIEVNRTNLSIFNLTLPDQAVWAQPYSFSIPYTGLWKVQFLLYKMGDLSSAYRQLHLYITVI